MKIIGTVGDSSYLVSMVPEELENLQDNYGGSTRRTNPVLIGREFQVNQSWTALRNLRNEVKELTKTANKLRALADLLEPIQCEIPIAKKEES